MDTPIENGQAASSSPDAPTLKVDFQWKKFKARITDSRDPSNPLYIVDFQSIRSPHIIVKSATTDETVGTGTLHPVSIHAGYQVHGQKGKLKAKHRWITEYTHLSYNYSDSNESPALMTWKSNCGFKTWNFICLDEQQNPVARFASNSWGIFKIGDIEFLGPKASDKAAREEIVVTGLTLFYCMMLRTTSILSFFGAIFASTGPMEKENGTTANSQHQEGQMHEMDSSLGDGNKPKQVAT